MGLRGMASLLWHVGLNCFPANSTMAASRRPSVTLLARRVGWLFSTSLRSFKLVFRPELTAIVFCPGMKTIIVFFLYSVFGFIFCYECFCDFLIKTSNWLFVLGSCFLTSILKSDICRCCHGCLFFTDRHVLYKQDYNHIQFSVENFCRTSVFNLNTFFGSKYF